MYSEIQTSLLEEEYGYVKSLLDQHYPDGCLPLSLVKLLLFSNIKWEYNEIEGWIYHGHTY